MRSHSNFSTLRLYARIVFKYESVAYGIPSFPAWLLVAWILSSFHFSSFIFVYRFVQSHYIKLPDYQNLKTSYDAIDSGNSSFSLFSICLSKYRNGGYCGCSGKLKCLLGQLQWRNLLVASFKNAQTTVFLVSTLLHISCFDVNSSIPCLLQK